MREHSLLPILKGSLQWDGATRFMTNTDPAKTKDTINVEFVSPFSSVTYSVL